MNWKFWQTLHGISRYFWNKINTYDLSCLAMRQ